MHAPNATVMVSNTIQTFYDNKSCHTRVAATRPPLPRTTCAVQGITSTNYSHQIKPSILLWVIKTQFHNMQAFIKVFSRARRSGWRTDVKCGAIFGACVLFPTCSFQISGHCCQIITLHTSKAGLNHSGFYLGNRFLYVRSNNCVNNFEQIK